MPSNEATVRRFYEVLNQADSVEAIMAELEQFMDPEIEWVNAADAIEGGTRRGIGGMRIVFENFVSGAGAGATVELDELKQRGDRVFVHVRAHVKGAASGAEVVGPPIGMIYTFRDGRVLKIEWHYDVAKARATFDESG